MATPALARAAIVELTTPAPSFLLTFGLPGFPSLLADLPICLKRYLIIGACSLPFPSVCCKGAPVAFVRLLETEVLLGFHPG